MSIKVIQVSSIVCPTPDVKTVNAFSLSRQEQLCVEMSPVTICIPQGVQGAQGPAGPQGIQGPEGPQGEPGQGVPPGGTVGQVLAKIDGDDYNTEWVDQTGGEVEYQESVTSAELFAKISASTLVPGLQYLISDFRSAWYHTDNGVTINNPGAGALFGPQYGPIEPLIVTALDVNKLSSQAFSTLFPADIISYDWNASNWTSDAFYSDGGTIIPDWRGVITERTDPIRGLKHTCDWRSVTFLRWAVDAPAYDAGTTYNLGDIVRRTNNLYCCTRYATVGIRPDRASNWVEVASQINVGNRRFLSTSSIGIQVTIPDIDNIESATCLVTATTETSTLNAFPTSPGVRELSIRGDLNYRAANTVISIEGNSCDFACNNSTLLAAYRATIAETSFNIFGSLQDGTIGKGCFNLLVPSISFFNIKSSSGDNIFAPVCQLFEIFGNRNIIKSGSNYFVAGEMADNEGVFVSCTIGYEFKFNRLARASVCKFGDGFYNNKSADTIGRATFGNACVTNEIGSVDNCVFGNDFSSNTGSFRRCNIGDNFTSNQFSVSIVSDLSGGANFGGGDYTAATLVYNTASKVFLLNENEDKLIQYVDGANTLVITNHDA